MIHTRRKCPLQNITLLDDKKIIEYHMTPNVGSAYYLHMCYRDSFSGLMTIWCFCGPRVGRHCLKKLCITHDSRSKVADFLSSFAFLKKQNFPGLLASTIFLDILKYAFLNWMSLELDYKDSQAIDQLLLFSTDSMHVQADQPRQSFLTVDKIWFVASVRVAQKVLKSR